MLTHLGELADASVPPQPPASAQEIFTRAVQQQYCVTNAALHQPDVKLLVSQAWASLGPEGQAPYHVRARQDLVRNQQEEAEYSQRQSQLSLLRMLVQRAGTLPNSAQLQPQQQHAAAAAPQLASMAALLHQLVSQLRDAAAGQAQHAQLPGLAQAVHQLLLQHQHAMQTTHQCGQQRQPPQRDAPPPQRQATQQERGVPPRAGNRADETSALPLLNTVDVSCQGVRGVMNIHELRVSCRCKGCLARPEREREFSMTQWEIHAGAANAKKWRASIRVVPGAVPDVPAGGNGMTVGSWLDMRGVDTGGGRGRRRGSLGPASHGGAAGQGHAGRRLRGDAFGIDDTTEESEEEESDESSEEEANKEESSERGGEGEEYEVTAEQDSDELLRHRINEEREAGGHRRSTSMLRSQERMLSAGGGPAGSGGDEGSPIEGAERHGAHPALGAGASGGQPAPPHEREQHEEFQPEGPAEQEPRQQHHNLRQRRPRHSHPALQLRPQRHQQQRRQQQQAEQQQRQEGQRALHKVGGRYQPWNEVHQASFRPIAVRYSGERCAVCDLDEDFDCDQWVSCDACGISVHQNCYGVAELPALHEPWLCHACELQAREQVGRGGVWEAQTPAATVANCSSDSDGPATTPHPSPMHHAQLTTNSSILEPVEGVQDIPRDRWELVCCVCRRRQGAKVQCAVPTCYEAYHPLCARMAGFHMEMVEEMGGDPDQYLRLISYCSSHYPPQPHLAGEAPRGVRQVQEGEDASDLPEALPTLPLLGNGQPYAAPPPAPLPTCPSGCARATPLDAGGWRREPRGPGGGVGSEAGFWIPTSPLPQSEQLQLWDGSCSQRNGAAAAAPLVQEPGRPSSQPQQPRPPKRPQADVADGLTAATGPGSAAHQPPKVQRLASPTGGSSPVQGEGLREEGGEALGLGHPGPRVAHPQQPHKQRARSGTPSSHRRLEQPQQPHAPQHGVVVAGSPPEGLLGTTCRIFWPLDREWCLAVVREYDAETGRHRVFYPADEEHEWLDLAAEDAEGRLQLLPPAEQRGAWPPPPPASGAQTGSGSGSPLRGEEANLPQVHWRCGKHAYLQARPHAPTAGATSHALSKVPLSRCWTPCDWASYRLRQQARRAAARGLPGPRASELARPVFSGGPSAGERLELCNATARERVTFGKSGIHGALEGCAAAGWQGLACGGDQAATAWQLTRATGTGGRGELVARSVADKRDAVYRAEGTDAFFFELDEEWVLDATRAGALCRFTNHSCAPSLYSKVLAVGGIPRLVFCARADIAPGQELTYNYRFKAEEDERRRLPCNCGAPNCCGYLN
eukprot:scaffold3.g6491.t1